MTSTTRDIGQYLDRQPPQAPEAEMALLGSIIHDGTVLGDVLQVVRGPEDFYLAKNAAIFEALLRIYDQGQPIDMVQLNQQLTDKGQLDQIGGLDYLIELAESVPSAATAVRYAKIVRDKARLRDAAGIFGEAIEKIYTDPDDPTVILDQVEADVFELAKRSDDRRAYTAGEIGHQIYERLERGEPGSAGIETGFIDLDKVLRGMKGSNMITISGRPSMGKSTLATNIAEHVSVNLKQPVAYFTLEMSREELTTRLIAGQSGVGVVKIDEGGLNGDQFAQVARAVGTFNDAPFHIVDKAGLSLRELCARSRRLVSKHDIGLIVVDYIQLMSGPGQSRSRYEMVTNISGGIKALAGELEVPIIAVSQLNRQPEGRTDHRPRMSDLKESGAIEQDSNVVILIHREEYYHKDPQWRREHQDKVNLTEVTIDKNRNGPTGRVKLVFDGPTTRFRNLQRD